MKFLHAADLHIDSPLRGLANYDGAPVDEIRGATRRAVENLVDAAIAHAVDFVVVAGDVFDGDWKDYSTGVFWVNQLGRLHDHNIPLIFVAGNHDAASEISKRLSLPPNVTLLSSSQPHTLVIADLDVAVIGQSYATRSVTHDLAAQYPIADPALFTIGLLHTSLDGRPGHTSYAPTTLDGLRNRGYGYWALGHVHQREVVATDPWIVFPGNVQGRHARETGAKGASLVTVIDSVVTTVEHLELDVVRWVDCSVDVSQLHSFEAVLDRVSSEIDHAALACTGRLLATRVDLVGTTPAHHELWKNLDRLDVEVRSLGASHHAIWIEKVKLSTRQPGDVNNELVDAIIARAATFTADSEKLFFLVSIFSDLKSKLPAELKTGEAPTPGSGDHIRSSLADAVALVTSLLSQVDAA